MRSHPDKIVEAAIAAAGEDTFDSESFRDGLALILSELDHLAPRLRAGARERLEGTATAFLVNRLKVAGYIRRNPSILAERIERPLFIFGMPRTGTTLVSNLLQQDWRRRSLLNWEAHNSAPPARPGALLDDARVSDRKALLDRAAEAFPALSKIHVEFADGPTECLSVHKQDFRALWWDAQAPMRRYSDWMLGCDMTPAYEWHKRVLQVLQSANPGAWQLKMPSHALHLHALLTVYPDARLIWTHRDPFKALGSLLSLIETVSGMNIEPDYEFMQWNYPRQAAEHLRRPMAIKKQLGDDRVFDLHYAELVRDPIGEMRRVYRFLGDELTPQAEASMRAWLEANPQGRFGEHSYSLEKFGLTVDGVAAHFEEYLSAYDVEREGRA